jgi:predicted enzyme related to lactoylglutathione lyase
VGGAGLQVWQEPGRAGRSTVVLGIEDVETEVARLREAGLQPVGAQPGGGGQVVELRDPDGNRAVLFCP